jgi:hypothetical protein
LGIAILRREPGESRGMGGEHRDKHERNEMHDWIWMVDAEDVGGRSASCRREVSSLIVLAENEDKWSSLKP